MNIKLVHDAIHLLQGEISPETGIILDLKDEDVLPMADLLLRYDLPTDRQSRLLSIYIAIKLALLRHRSCEGSGENLTRKVLDGDYLYSFYIELCLHWEEYELLSHLAPVIKQMQIKIIEGNPEDERLLKGWELFLQLENNRRRTSQAI
ncbi:hypothetical protein [Paenibacillus segetis]|uniref:Uncharacterized protein n=1 Tax=Paenibacillus segetis TaxID=1325360 RepID=A0ABQ1YVD5_9BACL|nr:hypothetical protein [Paenibacillus segetis]GGH37990.1 hypothetical protein GCM10008013_45770 [Paenibacillus segetis]